MLITGFPVLLTFAAMVAGLSEHVLLVNVKSDPISITRKAITLNHTSYKENALKSFQGGCKELN